MLDQPSRGGCRKQRSRPESGYRDSRDESPAVGKPFHQDGNRNDVAHAQPDSPNDPVGEIEPPQSIGGKTGEKYSPTPKQACHHRDDSRATPFHPQAAYYRRAPEKKPADQEDPGDFRNAPAEFLGERNAKDAPCVGRAEGHLHEHAGNGDPPTIQDWHDSSNSAPGQRPLRARPTRLFRTRTLALQFRTRETVSQLPPADTTLPRRAPGSAVGCGARLTGPLHRGKDT